MRSYIRRVSTQRREFERERTQRVLSDRSEKGRSLRDIPWGSSNGPNDGAWPAVFLGVEENLQMEKIQTLSEPRATWLIGGGENIGHFG